MLSELGGVATKVIGLPSEGMLFFEVGVVKEGGGVVKEGGVVTK